MNLYCFPCLTEGERVQAATIANGHAVCLSHLEQQFSNDAMTDTDKREYLQRTWQTQAFTADGEPIG